MLSDCDHLQEVSHCNTTSRIVLLNRLKANISLHDFTFPPRTPTEGFERLHQLNGELLPFWQLLQHLGHLVVSTANQAVAVDRLDHITNIDDLDLVNDAPLSNSLETAKLK